MISIATAMLIFLAFQTLSIFGVLIWMNLTYEERNFHLFLALIYLFVDILFYSAGLFDPLFPN